MKRKKMTAICMLTLMCLAAGCGSKEDEEEVSRPAHEREEAEAVTEAQVTETPEPTEEPEAVEEPVIAEKTEEIFSKAFNENLVVNNGSYFVQISDKVFFRAISPDSMEEGAVFGEFLTSEWNAKESPLICYDLNSHEWEEAGSITGVGKLYACPGGFYIGYMEDAQLDTYATYYYDMEKGTQEKYCDGLPVGISQSGEILVTNWVKGEYDKLVLVRDGEQIATVGEEDCYFDCCGFVGEELIMLKQNADIEYYLCSADEKGNVTELGYAGNSEQGYAQVDQFLTDGNDAYVSIGYYQGTGHFLSDWQALQAAPAVEGSVRTAIDSTNAETEYMDTVPVIYLDETGRLCDAAHVPYIAYMGDDNWSNLYYYDDSFEENLLVKDFIDNSYDDDCQIIQNITSNAETAFIIYADATEDQEYEIGWRTGYRRTGWHTCVIPFGYGQLDDNGLAKEIIIIQ